MKVCSGFHPAGYRQYGRRFLDTFARFWPASVALEVYTEEEVATPRGEICSLWGIPGAREFADRHVNNAEVHGRVPKPNWKGSERDKGYSYKHDAYKFWKQILIPEAASRSMEDGDVLAWFDGDVVTHKPVPERFVETLLGDADVVFLGREPRHSEIGFWAVRLNPATRHFLSAIANEYRSDAFLQLPEWHSAFVWDHVRRRAGLKERDLTPRGHGHVWPKTQLARYTSHLKGPRKGLGG